MGLSTYYLEFDNACTVFEDMIQYCKELVNNEPVTGRKKQPVIEFLDKFSTDLQKIATFLQYEYSKSHIDISCTDLCHCCTYALNE